MLSVYTALVTISLAAHADPSAPTIQDLSSFEATPHTDGSQVITQPLEEPHTDVAFAPPTLTELHAVWASQPAEDVLTEARLRIDTRDFAAADARLAFLVDTTEAAVAWFELGRSLELQERTREALDRYARALAGAETPELQRDIRYRQAIAHNDLGHHRDARSIAHTLRKSDALAPTATPVVDLELGVAEAGLGKRRGTRRITGALAALDTHGDAFAWARSRARFALVKQVLDNAQMLPIEGNKKAARNLMRRAEAIKAAEAQVIAIARTGEPEYALAGILALGDAYIALHDDLIAAPPPRSLNAEQADLYRQQVTERASVLRDKAFRFYDEGVTFAVRVQWEGGITERLKRRRAALAPTAGT